MTKVKGSSAEKSSGPEGKGEKDGSTGNNIGSRHSTQCLDGIKVGEENGVEEDTTMLSQWKSMKLNFQSIPLSLPCPLRRRCDNNFRYFVCDFVDCSLCEQFP